MAREKQPLLRRMGNAALVVVLLPLIVPLLIIVLLALVISRVGVYLLVWVLWLPRGKDTLFIYSDSPIWREYMINEVLPLVHERATVLNWSQRRTWKRWSLATWVFRAISGEGNYNPMVVMFRPLRRAQTFRFWSAFQDWKHGHPSSVERLTNELRIIL
jgi:hypothetical protein